MKKILLMAFAAVMFTQCGNKTAQNQAPAEEEDTISVVENEVMVFGICGEGSAMNTLEVITDTGDTLNLSLEKAKEEGHVYGGYSVGDRIAVYLLKKDNEPLVVINETTLMGNWLMPNPIDGSSTLGMSIKDGGIAESINQPTIIFKTWKIVNGQLEITLVREGGGDEEETNSYSMEKLDADSLIFYGPEDRFEYGREKRNDKKK